MKNYFDMHMDPMEARAISALGLAHMGDGVYEILVRAWLCDHGLTRVDNLHRETVAYVSAPAQSRFVEKLLPLLTEDEMWAYRRGKNTKLHAIPKHATPQEYSRATGLEALFGYLYLLGQTQRLNELFVTVMEELYGV